MHRTVTLASLVEKEGKLADERPRIAAVFENRLRIGMKLDCDPTTIYAALLQQHYRGVIHRSDLDSDHPYNTYRHAGLPPGPIANPGLASMRAVLAPSDSDSLYFVARADGSGGHEFSSNIAAHEGAVERYRRALRKVNPSNSSCATTWPPTSPAAITEAVWQDLLLRLAPVSESYLRDLLRDTGLPFDQPYAGIRQHTFEELEQSLRDMLQVYRDALAAGDRERARYCRRQVIAAKDRAKFLAVTPAHAHRKGAAQKEEMAQWMLVWLENPEVFPAWVDARKKAPAVPAPICTEVNRAAP